MPHIHGRPLRLVRLPDSEQDVGSIAPVPIYEGNELKRFDITIEFCEPHRTPDPSPSWPAVLPKWQIDQLQAENPDVDVSRWFVPMPEPPSVSRIPGWTPSIEPVERRIERQIAEQMGIDPPHLP